MKYLGGKSRLAKRIGAAILENTNQRGCYIEPMIGGGSVFFESAPHFQKSYGGDIQEDLILMYRALAEGWEPPNTLPEDEWRELRDSEPSALRAFAGFGCSFGGRFFEGYARCNRGDNYAARARKRLMRYSDTLETITIPPFFGHGDYDEWTPTPDCVVYLDPPYAGTKGYSSKRSGVPTFNHDAFWNTAAEWVTVRGAHVFVSEFAAPEGWTPVWERERSVGVGTMSGASYTKKTDKLFVYGKGYK